MKELDKVTTDYEAEVLWPKDYMPAFREFKSRYGHMLIPNNYVHRDGTMLGMLIRHLRKGYTAIPKRHVKELLDVLGLRVVTPHCLVKS